MRGRGERGRSPIVRFIIGYRYSRHITADDSKEGARIKETKAWVLYDVANSAFILFATSVLPIYFNDLAQADGLSKEQYLAYWSAAASVVTALMLLIGPTVGSYSDNKNWRKPVFITTVLIGVICCIALGLPKWWLAFLIILVICKIAYNASIVVYDSMLNDIVSDEEMDALSSRGFAMGYIGSCIPFIICLVFVVFSDLVDMAPNYFTFETAVVISLVITGIWWFVMSLPLFREYQQRHFNVVRNTALKEKFHYVMGTLKNIASNRSMLFFIIAFFFYIDGVNTVIELAVAYGEALELGSAGLLGALLLTQIIAFPSTLIMNKLAYKYGTHRIIYASIVGYIFVSLLAMMLSDIWEFFLLAALVGLFQGTIQALSRAYFGRMIPKDKTGEYFGILDVFGKGATILGTLTIAVLIEMLGEIRVVAMVLLFMFTCGMVFFHASVKEKVYDANDVSGE